MLSQSIISCSSVFATFPHLILLNPLDTLDSELGTAPVTTLGVVSEIWMGKETECEILTCTITRTSKIANEFKRYGFGNRQILFPTFFPTLPARVGEEKRSKKGEFRIYIFQKEETNCLHQSIRLTKGIVLFNKY